MGLPRGAKLKLLGLVLLAILALAVAGLAILKPITPPAVSDKVSNYTPPPQAEAPPAPKVVVFGDSFGQGAGASNKSGGWVYRLQRHQSWNLANLSRGGTGYTSKIVKKVAAQDSCRRDQCLNYRETVSEATQASPEIILVSGGRNDSKIGPNTETKAILDFYTELRATFPKAQIMATNPVWDNTPAPAAIARMAATIKEAVTSVGGTYLDIGQPLAGRADLIAPDGFHPTDTGHDLIFRAVLEKMRSAGIAREL